MILADCQMAGEAKLVTIANKNGMSIEVTNYGATLVGAVVPDKNGRHDDVVLGYADVTDYAEKRWIPGSLHRTKW